MQDALRVASSPHDFKLLVAAEGRTSTSMADLADTPRTPVAGPATMHRPGPSTVPTQNGSSAPPA
jgi:hypothetical protein